MTNGRREPFAIIPVRWFPKLKTAREWKVAAALASHADDETGEAFPSLATIAARATKASPPASLPETYPWTF